MPHGITYTSVCSSYRVGPAIAFHAVDTQMKCMHTQGVGERNELHSLQNYTDVGTIEYM